jgi:hypothetical protein
MRGITFKIFARLAMIGLGLLIALWFGGLLWTGYQLNELPGDGQITLGLDALPLTTGIRDGDVRSFRIGAGGYILGLLLACGPLLLSLAARMRRRPGDES